jgi:hypothetical protein
LSQIKWMPSFLNGIQVLRKLLVFASKNWKFMKVLIYTGWVYHFYTSVPCRYPLRAIYTRKNSQVVTNLQQTCSNAVPTTCQQDVFALLVLSLLTTCYKVVQRNRLVINCSNNLLSSRNSTSCQQVVSDNLVATW